MATFKDETGLNRSETDMLYVFVGSYIVDARSKLGISQKSLGKSVGLTRTSISNIENGRQRIQIHTLYAIAKALNVAPHSLLPELENRDLYKFKDSVSKYVTPAEALWVETVLTFESTQICADKLEPIEYWEIESAQELIDKAGITEPPVPIERIARQLGFQIRVVPSKQEITGLISRGFEEVIIGINSLVSIERQRFMIAYGLGHILTGRFSGFRLARDFRFITESENISHITDTLEITSIRFAIELLIPGTMLKRDRERYKADLKDDPLRRLAERYQVDTRIMTLRLDDRLPKFDEG